MREAGPPVKAVGTFRVYGRMLVWRGGWLAVRARCCSWVSDLFEIVLGGLLKAANPPILVMLARSRNAPGFDPGRAVDVPFAP